MKMFFYCLTIFGTGMVFGGEVVGPVITETTIGWVIWSVIFFILSTLVLVVKFKEKT